MKTLSLLKPIIYILTGLLIIIFYEQILSILPYVVGSIMILVNISSIITDIFLKEYNHIGYKIGIIMLGIIIITIVSEDFNAICIIWATISIINGGRSLIKSMLGINESILNIFSLFLAIVAIVLSIFLILNPENHVATHIILLGIEIILDGIRLILRKNINWNKPKARI